jgi:hypothetical protein
MVLSFQFPPQFVCAKKPSKDLFPLMKTDIFLFHLGQTWTASKNWSNTRTIGLILNMMGGLEWKNLTEDEKELLKSVERFEEEFVE